MRLKDGFKTLMTFSLNPSVEVWEIDVTPPGIDGGAPIEQTTMRNTDWRTFFPRSLKTLTPVTLTAAYSSTGLYVDLYAMINENQEMTITFADGGTVDFWGMIQTVTPGANSEGERPTLDVTVQPTNMDNSDVEQPPVHISGESQT